MNFIAPLFLLGALAVAMPIIFHLIRRTSKEKIPFSTLMFLLPTPPRVTRRSRIENLWLLLLRCLVLGLLALGFARPFLQRPADASPAEEGGRKWVLLLDTSASMRREGLWNQAKTRAATVLKGVHPGDVVAIYAFDRGMRPVLNFEEWTTSSPGDRTALAQRKIDELKPGWGGTQLGSALVRASELFDETGATVNTTGPRRIVLISDLQEGSKLDGLQGHEWPRGIDLVLETVAVRPVSNASIQLVTERTDAASASDNPVRVRVSNARDSKKEQFQIRRESGGTTDPVYVAPGQSRVVSAPQAPTNASADTILLTGDEEPFDNSVFVMPVRREEIPLLYLGANVPKDPAQSLYYVMRAFPETKRRQVKVVARAGNVGFSPAEWASAPMVIVTEALPETQLNAARGFLESGKSMFLVLNSAEVISTLGQLTGAADLKSSEVATGYAMLSQIDFTHPLFVPFADPRFSDFTKIHFWKHRRLDPAALAGARVVAGFDDGAPALLEVKVGKGVLYVLTSGWMPGDSQFALSSKFVPFLFSMLEQSGAVKGDVVQLTVGDSLPLPVGSASGAITVRSPDGTSVKVAAGETRFTGTDQTGLHTLVVGLVETQFAVNLAPDEGRTAPMAVEELEKLGLPLKRSPSQAGTLSKAAQAQIQAGELENRQKLWRWLIIGALIVIMVETWLAGRLSRTAALEPGVTL
ncbi:MAG: BatA domain-containing protein [Opitutaceae bacterium]|nr:BatA domain-containing protein [Verrucomicrobiales bacterium]